MRKTRNRLLGYGIVLCLAGIAFQLASTAIFGAVISALPQQDPAGFVIIGFIDSVVQSCLVPLGTAMIAISIALRMLGGRIRIDASEAGTGTDQPGLVHEPGDTEDHGRGGADAVETFTDGHHRTDS